MITRYIAIVVAVIMALMALGLYILKKENNKLHEDQGTYKTQIVELSSAIKEKDILLDAFSKRTDEMKAESDKRALDAEQSRVAARQAGRINRELADKLLAMQRKPNESDCEAVNNLFNQYLDMRSK